MKITKTPQPQLNNANQKNKDLKEACNQFEEYFVNMMLKNMKNTIGDSDLTEKSHGREIFEDMLDEKIASNMARGRGLGLASQMYKQLIKNKGINNL
ncbi:MAG: rod-binding protein [Anaeromicrobium sp.]|jgi:flagellar protein FlgJ|uniref:rod-binding protein n=1 Tax=Anaeromicrobium sp. TaxID=1929132 RepID=UPI0025E8D472|nr:rod-binding protein [Anaeromicrobium sp.]MCT4593946.1 rod-binding protein [Anaeromicrobium sp.]